jgi:hypothetical protein
MDPELSQEVCASLDFRLIFSGKMQPEIVPQFTVSLTDMGSTPINHTPTVVATPMTSLSQTDHEITQRCLSDVKYPRKDNHIFKTAETLGITLPDFCDATNTPLPFTTLTMANGDPFPTLTYDSVTQKLSG